MAFWLAFLALAALAAATDFPVGTCADLQTALTTNGGTVGDKILLTTDITCADTAWATIASLAGTLDGQAHTVTFTGTTSISGRAFVDTLTGTIKNIRFVGAVLGTGSGTVYLGFLVGTMASGLIENADLSVKAGTYSTSVTGGAGWLVGQMIAGSIRSSRVSGGSLGSVTLQAVGNVGGFVARQDGGTIESCFVFFMTIQGTSTIGFVAGAFLGFQGGGSLTFSVADGVSVKGTGGQLGGFAGMSQLGTITNCAAVDTANSGAVIDSSATNTGGFLGFCNGCTASENYVDLPGGMTCSSTVANCGGYLGKAGVRLSSVSTTADSYVRIVISGDSANKQVFVALSTGVTSGGQTNSITNCVYSINASPQSASADSFSFGLTDAQISAGNQNPMTNWDATNIWFFPGARLRFTVAADQLTIASVAATGISVAATLPTTLFASSDDFFLGYRLAVLPKTATKVSGSITTPIDVKIVNGASTTAVIPQPAIAAGQCFKIVMDLTAFSATHDPASRTVYGKLGSSWVQVDTFAASCTAFRRAAPLTKSGNTWTFFANTFTQFAVGCDAGLVDDGSTPAKCIAGSTGGDPHFRGLAGQKYLIGGKPGTVYNIISTPSLVVNALFGTTIGPEHMTVMQELGIVVGTDTIFANKFNRLQLNGVAAPASAVLSDGVSTLTRDINKTGDGITLRTPEFLLRWLPRGYEIDLSVVKLLRTGDASVHGLLGQSWNSGKWPASSLTTEITDSAVLFPALLDGSDESDYAVRDGLFGHEFAFSTFDSAAYPEVHAAPAMSKAGRTTK